MLPLIFCRLTISLINQLIVSPLSSFGTQALAPEMQHINDILSEIEQIFILNINTEFLFPFIGITTVVFI